MPLDIDPIPFENDFFEAAVKSVDRESLTRMRPECIHSKEDRWELRWNCGDWKYSSFEPGPQALADVCWWSHARMG